jgi:hypothetical protein
VTAEQLPAVIREYNAGLQTVFAVAIPLGGLACITCCFLEWKSVIQKGEEQIMTEKSEEAPS